MAAWGNFGEIANVAQITGVDAVRLIGLIVKAANTARMHKKNCRQFAQHLKLIGGLLEQLKISELKKYPETREPLEQLEDSLRKSYLLVNSCQDRSYLYLLAMGWNIVYQFRKAQNEIDRYLRLIPLITLVDNTRIRGMQDRLEYIERDQCEYTLDEEDRKVQDLILKSESVKDQSIVLKKTLSCSYPNMCFNEALKKESEKLQMELQRSQSNMDVSQCEVIQHLLEVTEVAAANVVPEKSPPKMVSKKFEPNYSDINASSVSSGHDLLSRKGSSHDEEWQTDLLGCCSEPLLSRPLLLINCSSELNMVKLYDLMIAASAEACNELMAYSLVLSCCCYTCCIRRKLRNMFNISGGFIDDFLSHLMCCCCALVQEWREIEIRGAYGPEKTKTSPPPLQSMES
ncbi:Protein MID1-COMPLEMENTING ACTIVITY 1 [Linum perenne]